MQLGVQVVRPFYLFVEGSLLPSFMQLGNQVGASILSIRGEGPFGRPSFEPNIELRGEAGGRDGTAHFLKADRQFLFSRSRVAATPGSFSFPPPGENPQSASTQFRRVHSQRSHLFSNLEESSFNVQRASPRARHDGEFNQRATRLDDPRTGVGAAPPSFLQFAQAERNLPKMCKETTMAMNTKESTSTVVGPT